MNETMTKIGSYTVSATGGDTTVTFYNIPSYYTDLRVYLSLRSTDSAAQGMNIAFNGTTTGFSGIYLYSDGTNKSSSSLARYVGSVWGTNGTASTFNSTEIYIPNYTSSYPKNFSVNNVADALSSTGHENIMSGTWSNTSPITSISFTVISASNFAQNSEFTLYGIKNMANVLGNSVRASGGTITTDGTYVYHTFAATDKFVVNQPLLATDVLVIAGGASGSQRFGNGGGAGGVSYLANKTFPIGTYPCTVGAGGAPDVVASASFGGGSPGTNSTFLSIISNGGGNGSTAGGSGGGGHGSASTSPGGASNQGNTGGATGYGNAGGNWTANSYGGGGGGGAGSAGTANGSTNGVAGGNGLNTWAYLAGPTNTGVNGYYAGGGASGANGGGPTSGGTGGLGGGGNGGGYGNFTQASGTAGVANTGSGGGGSGYSPDNTQGYSGAGGSGVVILRYKA